MSNEALNPRAGESEAPTATEGESTTGTPTGVTVGEYRNAQAFAEGITSVVYKARSHAEQAGGEQTVALKVVRSSDPQPPHDPKREARILRKAAGSRVIALLETFQAGFPFVLVFPFMALDLGSALKDNRLKPAQIQAHLRQLFEALKYIHNLDIIHRDVKPSALLLVSLNGPAYLSDFGISWMLEDPDSEKPGEKHTEVGTGCYRPPELLFGHRSYSTSLDLWSAGCVVAEALSPTRQSLFDSGPIGTDLSLLKSVFSQLGTPTLEEWPEAAGFPDWGKMDFHTYEKKAWSDILPDVSEEGRDLVERLVRYESAERRPAVEVCVERLCLLEHFADMV